MFALNRGLRGLFPCTVCHIPQASLSNITGTFRLRVNKDAQDIVNSDSNIGTKREATKQIGMRNVPVSVLLFDPIERLKTHCAQSAFWNIAHTDIHEVMSFDRLHAYILGLWQKHLFDQFKKIVEDLSREARVRIEDL